MTATANGMVPVPPDGSDPARGRLRVVFLMRVEPSAQARFLDAYQQIRQQVASTAGHLVDQLCQSIADPAEWMIVSEWATPEHFLAWEGTDQHRELAAPLISCTTRRQSFRFVVHYQTLGKSGVEPVRSGPPRGITTISVDIGGSR